MYGAVNRNESSKMDPGWTHVHHWGFTHTTHCQDQFTIFEKVNTPQNPEKMHQEQHLSILFPFESVT